MKSNNHFFVVSITYGEAKRDFVIRNAQNPQEAGDKAMRRAHAIGWIDPTVQSIAEQLLTDGSTPKFAS